MKLGLSSGALPDASLAELAAAAARRGLGVLELRDGDAHGVSPARPLEAAAMLAHGCDHGVDIAVYRAGSTVHSLRLARLGELLDLQILVDGPIDLGARLRRALRLATDAPSVAVVVRGPEAVQQACRACERGLDVAWDVEFDSNTPGETASGLLDAVGPRLRHVRLHGAGPEAALHEGKGIGDLTGRLALAGYDGTLLLTPSSGRYRVAWQAWLGRRGGWGCGGSLADPELVTMSRSLS